MGSRVTRLMTRPKEHQSRLVTFTARLTTFLPWLDARRAEISNDDLVGSIATIAELTHQLHHVYEPLMDTPQPKSVGHREQLADALVTELDRQQPNTLLDRAVLAQFWRLVASLIWSTTRTHRDLRDEVGVSDDVGVETLRQHRFSTQNAHEAWALVLEGFYEKGAAEEATRWLLSHIRDCARRDYRTILLPDQTARSLSIDSSIGEPTLNALSLSGSMSLALDVGSDVYTIDGDPNGEPTAE